VQADFVQAEDSRQWHRLLGRGLTQGESGQESFILGFGKGAVLDWTWRRHGFSTRGGSAESFIDRRSPGMGGCG